MGKKELIQWGPAIIFFAILLLVLLDQYGLFGSNTASLKITNQTATGLSEISVVLYETPCVIESLAPGASSVCSFEIESDAHYKITWREAEAGNHKEEVGYVTHGFDFNHELEILGEGKVGFQTGETP